MCANAMKSGPHNSHVYLNTDRQLAVETIQTLCPVCEGRGHVEKGFYGDGETHVLKNGAIREKCRRCGASGTIPGTRTVTS